MTASVIPERNRLAVNTVKLISKAVLSPFFKSNIRGINNIPQKGSFVLLPKHNRWEDIPLIAISVQRPLYFVAKQELFNNSISRKLFAMLGGLPLDRSRPVRSRDTLMRVMQKINDGEGVVIFPEGTYYKNHIGPGHAGLIKMVHSNINTVFIPVGIKYAGTRLRKTIRIIFGNPVKNDYFKKPEELFAFIMKEIAGLSGLVNDTALNLFGVNSDGR